jgi:nucleotide-binding universal stress UspA family protein
MITARGPFRNILCPVDFSEDSRAALRHAAAIAGRAGGRLTVMFVNDPLLVAAAAVAYDKRVLEQATGKELRRFVTTSLGPKHAQTADTIVVLGNPSREIRKAVRRLGTDLVVIGTRGLGRAGKLFFGSTAERVLRHADVSTLVVPRAAGRQRAPSRSWPGRVVAAFDVTDRPGSGVRTAREVAHWFDARLSLITVVRPTQVPAWLQRHAADHERKRMTVARAQLEALAGHAGSRRIATRVLSGDPAEQISAAAVDGRAGLIILRLRAPHRLLDAPQGSVTYKVLCRSAVPVLALAERARSAR